MENFPSVVDKPPLEFTTPPRRFLSWVPIVLVALGIVVVGAGLVMKNNPVPHINQSNFQTADGEVESASISAKTVFVDISGAVERPGVYQLPDNSRIKDVLITAGGLIAKADRNYLSKNINLAQKLADGQKVYIPFEGEQPSPIDNKSSPASGLVSINNSSQSQLESLPGIGPVTAAKIISDRPYKNLSELVAKKTVGRSLFEKIKGSLSL